MPAHHPCGRDLPQQGAIAAQALGARAGPAGLPLPPCCLNPHGKPSRSAFSVYYRSVCRAPKQARRYIRSHGPTNARACNTDPACAVTTGMSTVERETKVTTILQLTVV